LAVDATGFPAASALRVEHLLGALGISTRWPRSLDVGRVVLAARHDKKRRRGEARYALPRALGRTSRDGDVTVVIPDPSLARALARLARGRGRPETTARV